MALHFWGTKEDYAGVLRASGEVSLPTLYTLGNLQFLSSISNNKIADQASVSKVLSFLLFFILVGTILLIILWMYYIFW